MHVQYPSIRGDSAESVGFNLLADLSKFVAVGEARTRVGKRLFYAPADNPTDAWRPDDERAGKWVKPKDIGQGADTNIGKNYQWRLYDTDTHAQRLALRKLVASDVHKCMILGLPNEENFARFTPQADHLLCPYGQFTRGKSAFRDTPRAWLTMDIDGLDLRRIDADVDVHADAERMPDLLRDALDDMGLDWLIADCIIQFSSTHGLHSTHHLKAHIEWRLAQPLTVAQQKLVAGYCNTQATSKGYGTPFDTAIYDINRIFFTAPPELLKRVWVPDQGITNVPAPHPYKSERVLRSEQGIERVGVPDDAFEQARNEAKVAQFSRMIGLSPLSATNLKLAPGRVHEYIRGKSFAAARRAPRGFEAAWQKSTRTRLVNEIRNMPGASPEKTQSRLDEHLSEEAFEHYWQGAMEKRRQAETRVLGSPAHTLSIEEARVALIRDITNCVQSALLAEATPVSAELISPRPAHTLIVAPPGIGKTEAALSALTANLSVLQRGLFLMPVPTEKLGAELLARVQKLLPDEHRRLARQHKGRRWHCESETYGAQAKLLEKAGCSPRKSVCASCPLAHSCGWLAQHKDMGPGLVIVTHAHLTTAFNSLKLSSPDMPLMVIVDEGLLSTLLPAPKKRSLAALLKKANKVVMRKELNAIAYSKTTDLIAARSQCLSIIEQLAKSKLPVLPLSELGPLTEEWVASALSDEIAAKYASEASLSRLVTDRLANRGTAKVLSGRIASARAQVKLANWFIELYGAIQDSLSARNRSHVWGVRFGYSAKRAQASVFIQRRARLPFVLSCRHCVWLDGTANEEVWRLLLAGANLDTSVNRYPVMAQHFRQIQYLDKDYPKKMFSAEGTNLNANINRLHRFLLERSQEHSDVLVVTQLDVATMLLQKLGGTVVWQCEGKVDVNETRWVVDNIHIKHFNALRGLDAYKNFPCAVVVGRPMPRWSDLELMAEALLADQPDASPFVTTNVGIDTETWLATTHGHERKVTRSLHPDARVEALREQIADAEVRQAVNRLRVYDRTPDNPAEIHVFGLANTGLPVAEARDWSDAECSPIGLMIMGGVYSDRPDVRRRLAGGILRGKSNRQIQRIVDAYFSQNSDICPVKIEDEYSPRANVRILQNASPSGSCWVEWSVRADGWANASGVFVDAHIWGEGVENARVAIEAETGLSLNRIDLAVAVRRPPAARRDPLPRPHEGDIPAPALKRAARAHVIGGEAR